MRSHHGSATDYSEPHGHLAQLRRVTKASTIPLNAYGKVVFIADGMGFMGVCYVAVASSHAAFPRPSLCMPAHRRDPKQPIQPLLHIQRRRNLEQK